MVLVMLRVKSEEAVAETQHMSIHLSTPHPILGGSENPEGNIYPLPIRGEQRLVREMVLGLGRGRTPLQARGYIECV